MLYLQELKISFETDIQPGEPDDHFLPVLQSSDFAMSGWYAIVEYLNSYKTLHHPDPTDSLERQAQVRSCAQWCIEVLWEKSARKIVFHKAHRFLWRVKGGDYSVLTRAIEQTKAYLAQADASLENLQYMVADEVSLADLALASAISCIDYLGQVRWKHYNNLYRWYMSVKSRPSFQKLLEDRISFIPPASHYTKLDWDQDCIL